MWPVEASFHSQIVPPRRCLGSASGPAFSTGCALGASPLRRWGSTDGGTSMLQGTSTGVAVAGSCVGGGAVGVEEALGVGVTGAAATGDVVAGVTTRAP